MWCSSPDDLESNASTELSFAPDIRHLAPDQFLETLLIFDWDDTLFPSTWLEQLGSQNCQIVDLSGDEQVQLQELGRCVERTLSLAMQHGRVVIVTNAAAGWVEHSCSKFLPALCPLLEKLDIISARSSYERFAPGFPVEWKRLAFGDVVDAAYEDCDADQWRNIISIGDAMFEHDALASVTKDMRHCLAKTVKFSERPALEHLIEEHHVLCSCLHDVVGQDVCLDLEVGETAEL